jgi:hypothetical protein
MLSLPYLTSDNPIINSAFRIALGDLVGNIQPFQEGLLSEPKRCILAGLEYNTPWTRDTAINVWNGAGLIFPAESRNTLLSVLERHEDHRITIGGQYWDAIIWTTGAWAYYLYTGDKDFLALAQTATLNSLEHFEKTEYDPLTGLFRGPACYGDGIAAYPDRYAQTKNSTCILDWPACNPDLAVPTGYGIPMHALSTNCLYYSAYRLLDEMAVELYLPVDPAWNRKAAALRIAINANFWSGAGNYRYLVDGWGGCDHQEGLGSSFALLFGVADPDQALQVLKNQVITPHGIPCVWPTFNRYRRTPDSYGRHSGTVWPHIQGFWAEAAARVGDRKKFQHEFLSLAQAATRDGMFAEIYHPDTGAVYGGLQEGIPDWQWHSCLRQTWSATAFLRMVLMGMFGMRFSPQGITFHPLLPEDVTQVVLNDLPYRNQILQVTITGSGNQVKQFEIGGKKTVDAFLSNIGDGERIIEIELG